jgi:hypothetical protein
VEMPLQIRDRTNRPTFSSFGNDFDAAFEHTFTAVFSGQCHGSATDLRSTGRLRARLVGRLRPIRSFGGDQERSVASQVVRFTAYDELHRLSGFQRCVDRSRARNDLDPEAAAAPLKIKAEAAPIWRELRVDGDAVAPQ